MQLLSELAMWVVDVVEKAGYLGVGALVALENIVPPIPSEVILPMAGFLTGQGKLNFFLAVGAATVGSVVGALVLYKLGQRMGEDRTRSFMERRGKWLLVSGEDFDKASAWFERHREKAVFIGRFAPGVRSFISIPAGIQNMSMSKFIAFTAAGSAVYNSVLVGLGWLLGNNWKKVSEYTGIVEAVLWVLLAAAIGYWIYRKKFRHRAEPKHS